MIVVVVVIVGGSGRTSGIGRGSGSVNGIL